MDGAIGSSTALATAGSQVMLAATTVIDEQEAFAVLTAQAGRHATGVSPRLLARQALAATTGTDFAVASDALDALLSRAKAMKRDGIEVLRGPAARGAVCGAYRVGRRGDARQYDVWLERIDAEAELWRASSRLPAAGSCACADYAKAGLGLCKHLLAVLAASAARSAVLGGATSEADGPWLCWDPVRPFTGAGDWLERVRWCERARAPRGAAAERVMALFERAGEARRLRARTVDVAARRSVVEALSTWIEGARADVAEPALRPLLRAERERLARLADAVPPRDVLRHLGGLKQKLFAYQREGVRRFLADGRLLLADDMGLGKTAQAIAACHVLFAAGRVTRGMIVVPAALKAQWAREWKQFTDLELTIVDGSADERARIYRRRGGGVLLVNYEQVLRDLPHMQAFVPQVVVLDEAQRIKNWAAKTSAYVKRLDAAWRLVLTGTPMENRLLELSSILDWVDEGALEPRWRLGSWHAVHADGSREVVGARNLETLRARLRPCMLRRLRTDVMSQLPSRRDTLVSVEMTDAQREAHAELEPPIARLVAIARRRPLTQPDFLRLMSLMTRQRIICNGLAQRDFEEVWPALARGRHATETVLARLAMPKLRELRERIAALAIDQGRKVVVFSQWRRMLELAAWAVGDVLAGGGARGVFFTGDESQRRRTQNLVDFHDDPAVRVLFATDAGGVGLNLQKAASCVVNLDLPWNPAVLEQRIGRVHRFGQKQPVDVYALVAEAGIEARIAGLVGDKKALFRGLFDGSSDTVEFAQAGSFLSRIEQLIERPEVPAAAAAAVEADEPVDDGDGEADGDGDGDADARASRDVPAASGAPAAASASGADVDVDARAAGASGGSDDDAAAVSRLLSQIELRPLPDGRISIEAPPAAAATLATMLRGLAALLEQRPS